MEKICDKNHCTGCMACYNACPKSAIKMKIIDGFYYPEIDNNKCIDCGKCKKTCPAINDIYKSKPIDSKAYAILNKDKKIRDNSSSGGVFYNLAITIIRENGVVYGASWDNNLHVNHIRINEGKDIKLLQGSKYVQSCINNIFQQVKNDLDNNLLVLFSGVPCQIAGLRAFLKKEYENLYTCEVLCHGSASPVFFEDHKALIEEKHNSKLIKINHRFKTTKKCQNIEYTFDNGKKVFIDEPTKDYYYLGFQDGTLLRDSCFTCKYIGINRCADITLADFWGLKNDSFKCKDELSFPSLVFINTNKGKKIFSECMDNFEIIERPLEEAVLGNLSLRRPLPYNKYKEKFLKTYEKQGYEAAASKYLIPKQNIKTIIKKIVGKKMTRFLIKVMKR